MKCLFRIILMVCLFSFCCPGGLLAKEGESPAKKAKAKVKQKAKAPAKKAAAKRPVAKEPVPEPEPPPSLAVLSEIKHWSNPDYTRLAISLDHEVRYESHQLKQNPADGQPARMYIDIPNAKVGPGVTNVPIGDGLLKGVRVAQYKTDTVRVVLDIETIRDFKIFTFANPFRIIIDVRGERREELRALPSAVIQAAPAPLPAPALTPLTPAELAAQPESKVVSEPPRSKPVGKPVTPLGKVRRVVVDAGHGGHDPGAVGRSGTQEKDVVLQLALKLARKLRDDLGLDVVLTRSTDVFVELQERTAIANKVGADLFVSVHANAAPNRGANGIETYYLNLAKTEKVAQLAATENGTSLEKVSMLQAVLFDLLANYKLNDSAHLAEEVQKALYKRIAARYTPVKNLGVKQGPFYVLVGASMPSILVEAAFVSNANEEARLNDPRYLDDTADGIADGIRSYVSAVKRGEVKP
jgi:N-acetylmuramoyl-L-alanine amidase